METYKERVINEKSALDDNIKRLEEFIVCDKFTTLEEIEKHDLLLQLTQMQRYSNTLAKRIKRF